MAQRFVPRGDGGRTIKVRDTWGNILWTKIKSRTQDGWTVEDVVRRVEGKVERQRRQGIMRFCLSGPLKKGFDAQGKQERQREWEIYQMDGTKIEQTKSVKKWNEEENTMWLTTEAEQGLGQEKAEKK